MKVETFFKYLWILPVVVFTILVILGSQMHPSFLIIA